MRSIKSKLDNVLVPIDLAKCIFVLTDLVGHCAKLSFFFIINSLLSFSAGYYSAPNFFEFEKNLNCIGALSF